MTAEALRSVAQQFSTAGFVSPIRLMSSQSAAQHRAAMESAEAQIGNLHYKPKIHTLVRSAYEIATTPAVLDIIEQLIGIDVLLYNATYIIKEPGSQAHVSWHQDLTYWGLDNDSQVSMWVALSPASELTGCMQMIPGSHLNGQFEHLATDDPDNILLQGQTVPDVASGQAIACPLEPGEASLHHGWTLHASMPNNGTDRRIGLNFQYLATHVRQLKHDADTAMLVRGVDRYRHFGHDLPASGPIDAQALAQHRQLEQRYIAIAGQA